MKRFNVWHGKGFELRDGRVCAGFRVSAGSEEEAKRLLNRVAGWNWFKEEPLAESKYRQISGAEVQIRWKTGEEFVLVDVPRRGGRLPETNPSGATERVQKSVQRLIEEGGHRSTVRFSKKPWDDLRFLMSELGMQQSEVLEKLIQDRASELRKKGDR